MNKVFINGLKENPLIFTDIGAAGGISKRWDDLKESIITILFEPNKESFNDLKLNNDKKSIILNKALFSEKKIININICRKPEVSSIYKPSIEFISNFYDSKRFDIIDIIELEADTLSNQLNISISKCIMALAYGDQVSNMLQPFWALPLLGITGLKAKEILPYSLFLMIIGSMIFLLGLMSIKKLERPVLFVGYTVLIWVGYITMMYIPFWMFDLPLKFDLGWADAAILTMASAVALSIPTPGGIGSYHYFISYSLGILYMVPEPTGLAFATITHAATLAMVILVAPAALAVDKFLSLQREVTAQNV